MKYGKTIEVIRYTSLFPDKRKKDNFDSVVKVFMGDIDLPIYECDQVNTDPRKNYPGGKVAPGRYAWIKGIRQSGKEAIFLFEPAYYESVFKVSDLNLDMRTLPSSVPNPNHSGKPIISCVLWHSDQDEGGSSEGCFTQQPYNFQKFISLFAINEKGFIDVKES